MEFPFLQGKPCAAQPLRRDPPTNTAEFLGNDLAVRSMDDGPAKLEQWIANTPGKKIAMVTPGRLGHLQLAAQAFQRSVGRRPAS